MDTRELEHILFEELGYADSPGLLQGDSIPWLNGRAIPDINAAFFLENVPVAYFSRLIELDLDKIRQLHKNVWSQSKTPLLFVILPHEIRIYNGYDPTPSQSDEFDTSTRLLRKLERLTDELVACEAIRSQLVESHYERVYLETGAFWDTTEGQRVSHEGRADHRLVESMRQMRRLLIEEGLSNHVAYALLGRSVLIRYLEDRGALTPGWISRLTDGRADSYCDALADRFTTYLLFEQLSQRFDGDLFPVEGEEDTVSEVHLEVLRSFLSGTDLQTGQMSLLPYNFEYIPIELISNIYDIFLDDRRAAGAYYTPLLLADFLIEETMGADTIHPNMTILDPACGSGVFLLGAYRRLVQAWRQVNGVPSAADLSQILCASIFGVDKEPEAIRIAAFSLYLEILNHLDNKQIRDGSFRFPTLKDNLLACDFFEQEVERQFADRRFDRILGNMPWGQSTLTETASKWLKENDYVVGGKQAAPAFMLRISQFCKTDGEMAVLAPAKGTIMVTSPPHQAFRDRFFSSYNVRAVVNFAPLVYELFPEAISPAVAVFYTPGAPTTDGKLIYGVPKPSSISRYLGAIVLDTTEIKFLALEQLLAQPQLWKVALWGRPRDAALIEKLRSMPRLGDQAKKLDLTMGQGIQINGGDENPAPWLVGMRLVPTNRMRPYSIDLSVCTTIEERVFHRPRTPDLVQAPLALIHRSQCSAAFSDEDVAYRDKITGIAGTQGQEWLLKWLVAYINSPLAKYYQFLTSTSWAVERKTIIQWEYEEMPFLVPAKDDERLRSIRHHLDAIEALLADKDDFSAFVKRQQISKHEEVINNLVLDIYGLHPLEKQLVSDMLEYGIAFFEWSKGKRRKIGGVESVQRPNVDMLTSYADLFMRTVSPLLQLKNQALNAIVYRNGAPLTIVSFEFVDVDNAQPVQVMTAPDAMRERLYELDRLALKRKTPSVYVRRHVRIYDNAQVSLVRPSEQRFWTKSQALADADAFLAELLA